MMEQVKGKWIIYKKNKAYVSALILDNYLEKIQIEPCVHDQIGSIYIGKIQKIVKNIQAAFVEIAADIICYLPLNELDTPKKEGDQILVQIIQEAAKTKQATVSTNLSLSGKYCVVSVGGKKLHFSKKLHSGMKNNLVQYFRDENIIDENSNLTFIEQNFSVIVRTNAIELNSYEILKEEILELTKQLANIIQVASHRTLYSVVYRVMEPYLRTIQDSYGSEYGEIITEDMEIYNSLRDFLSLKETDSVKLSFYE
jgi:ribonuclease G